MSPRTADFLEAIEHLPDGATLVIPQFTWGEYEQVLAELQGRPHLRVSYDRGTLQVMSPLPEHEVYARFIDALVRVVADVREVPLQSYSSATWKRGRLARGVEPDCSYYVTNAERIIGRRTLDLESDPPPDIVVEIDVTNESLAKFPIYAALAVPEIWRYDGETAHFYGLAGGEFVEIDESRFLTGLTPGILAEALAQMKAVGQTSALRSFRQRWT